MKIKPFFALVFCLVFLLSACQQGSTVNGGKPVPTPSSGKATVTGRLISETDSSPYKQTEVRLAQVFRKDNQGAFVLDTSHAPGAFTDENGYFVITEVSPAEYVVVVGDPMGSYMIIPDGNDNARTWTVEADKTLDLSVLKIKFTP